MQATKEAPTTKDQRRAPRVLVTCRNCGNSGHAHEFETPHGTLACGDCGHTRYFQVERVEAQS